MKSKYITHIILEGADGVGKDTVCAALWPKYNFMQRVYVRGELSDYVYAKKYNRKFIGTQRGLPFLYVLLTLDKKEIANRIQKRGAETDDEVQLELNKIDDQDEFIKAAELFRQDYHIIVADTTGLTPEEVANKVYNLTKEYINSLPCDPEINQFNVMYDKGCKVFGTKLTVRNNQPFFDDKMIMADAQLHNGDYETFTDKTCPHNFIFSLGYNKKNVKKEKLYDFCYPINSKILVRQEIRDYIDVIVKSGKTILTTDSQYIPQNKNIIRFPKKFGDDYIKEIAQAKATIYTARDLAYIEMITVRPYEATFANQVIFVDKLSDPENKLLTQIYRNSKIKDLLYVDETTLIKNYDEIFSDPKKVDYILRMQHLWYKTLVKELVKHEN